MEWERNINVWQGNMIIRQFGLQLFIHLALTKSLQPQQPSIQQDSFVSSEALILGLAKEDGFLQSALFNQGKGYKDVLDAVTAIREKSGPATSRSAENMYDALKKYGIDFTEQAEKGKLDPVIGRDDEIRRAIQILSRRTKNNPVLIGDPGVGK